MPSGGRADRRNERGRGRGGGDEAPQSEHAEFEAHCAPEGEHGGVRVRW